jgi:hypothetical protein
MMPGNIIRARSSAALNCFIAQLLGTSNHEPRGLFDEQLHGAGAGLVAAGPVR